jgi:diketogulonate reductase-like aldo/keto reductase
VEGSLRRLKLERIDLLQMRWPAEDGTPLILPGREALEFGNGIGVLRPAGVDPSPRSRPARIS